MRTCVLFLIMAAAACGQTVAINLRYPELKLKNGNALTGVTILSFDSEQRTINVVSGKSLKKLDVKLLPDDIVKQLEILNPRRSEPERIKLQQRMADAEREAQKQAAQRAEEAEIERNARRDAERRQNMSVNEHEKARVAGTEGEVAETAEAYARQFFKYQNDPHSSVGAVLSVALQMNDPELVAGWSNRWRVSGTAGLAYATNNAGMLGRKVREFEILLEMPAKGKPKVVDLRVK